MTFIVAILISGNSQKKKESAVSRTKSHNTRGRKLQKRHGTKGAKTNDLNCALTDAVVKVNSSSVCILKVLVAVQQLSSTPSAVVISCWAKSYWFRKKKMY